MSWQFAPIQVVDAATETAIFMLPVPPGRIYQIGGISVHCVVKGGVLTLRGTHVKNDQDVEFFKDTSWSIEQGKQIFLNSGRAQGSIEVTQGFPERIWGDLKLFAATAGGGTSKFCVSCLYRDITDETVNTGSGSGGGGNQWPLQSTLVSASNIAPGAGPIDSMWEIARLSVPPGQVWRIEDVFVMAPQGVGAMGMKLFYEYGGQEYIVGDEGLMTSLPSSGYAMSIHRGINRGTDFITGFPKHARGDIGIRIQHNGSATNQFYILFEWTRIQ